jgi:hypothetical protein
MSTRDHDWFVGEMGLTFEADGFTRIGGRLFGHLLLAERRSRSTRSPNHSA